MSGKYLLDTNIVIALMNGDVSVKHEIAAATDVFVSVVVIAELLFGARKSSKRDRNLAAIRSFATAVDALPSDIVTAEEYGVVKSQLREVGRPIPENDVWSAATARQHSLTLVTRDQHFEAVVGLSVIRW